MARLLLIAALVGLALARPETYREKEDFQFSRSSSDEGSKSGFYGAQRGNMGGNYEKAHNMDSLAQKQMSSAVNQVTGELGDTRDMNVGRVFTAANTRGIYSQGQYDLSNLQGRNFEETGSFGGPEASSQYSGYGGHSLHNSAFTSGQSAYSAGNSAFSGHNSRYTGYHAPDAETLHKNNLQAMDQLRSGYREAYGRQSGYGSESRIYNQGNVYDQQQSNLYAADRQYATKNRLVGANGAPVKIVIRPGSTVNVPVAAETFEDRQASAISSHDSVNRDVEVIANPVRDHVVVRPTGASKHYESSYNYQKEWEKHDTKPVPLAIPTGIPQNKELYDDVQGTAGSEFQGNSIASSDYQATANSHYQAQSQYNTQRHSGAYGAHDDAYTGAHRNGALLEVGSAPAAPKKYESSYSYHKSWARQGDPYVIEPVHPVPADSQRLTAATNQQAYGSHQYGSQHKSSHQSYTKSGALVDCDCDDETHSRVARSVDSINQKNYDYNPYSQDSEQQEELTQQIQSGNFEKLMSHGGWYRNSERQEDVGQQAQNQWDNLEQFGRSTQAQAEDLGQQTQDTWGNLESVNRGESLKLKKDMNEHVIPVWEQSQDDSQHILVHPFNSAENGPYFKPTIGNVNFPMNLPEMEGSLNHHSYAHSTYEESHQHDNFETTMHEFTHENQNKNQSPIQSVWDRIEGLQQTLKSNSDSIEKDEHWHGYDKQYFNSQSFMQNSHGDSGFMQNSHHDQNDFRWHTGQVPSPELLPPITDKTSDVTVSTILKPFVNFDDKKPKNIGRGDIGDDDLTNGVTQPTVNQPTTQIYTSPSTQQTKPYKTPAEIDALSLRKEQEKQADTVNHSAQSEVQSEHAITQSDSGLDVISLSKQKNRENNYFRNTANSSINIHKENHDTENANRETFNQANQSSNSDSSLIARHEITQENVSKHEDNDDYHVNFDQQFLNMFHEAMAEQTETGVFDQHASDQFEHLGQETVNLHVPGESLSTFDTQKPQSHQPGYLGQETVKFDLPSESLSSFNKHNTQIPSMGQETELNSDAHTFESQYTQEHQHEYVGQETEKLEIPNESLNSFGTQKSQDEDLSQQSVSLHEFLHSLNNQHENHDQQSFTGYDHNTDQQSEDLGQHSIDLQQQDKLDNFNKYVYDPSDKSKNLEQTDEVQVPSNFDARSSLQVPQKDNFYKERYVANSGTPTEPKSTQDKVEAKQSDAEVAATVTEVTTEKTGFWKSVGNKFVSAKDKVSSWFSKS